ncbi:MAG: GNAT family N-acetyltransferase [Bacteroidia bacterium]|nr:GNAT family N-acetyltransferase [Bacteroidia bacterium]
MPYFIEEVRDNSSRSAFYKVQHIIYAGDENWVCPLDEEIESIFNPQTNVYFSHGNATRFILKDEKGNLTGRIAVFYNSKKAFNFEIPTGGVGFFECINNQEAADMLFNTAKEWLTKNGMLAMDGPINFSENDNFWGLLVEGFSQPAYGMPYNKPYYRELFENYGFKLFFEQISNELDISQPLPERFAKISQWITQKEGYRFVRPNLEQLSLFGKAFQEVYNDAWQFHENFTPISDEQIEKYVKRFRFIAIDAFLPFAYVNDEPAGFIICVPDLNQIFKPLKGSFSIFQKLLFWWRSRNQFEWYRKNKILTRGRVIIMGVKPKFQKYGLESGLIYQSVTQAAEMGFEKIELSWVGDFNPKMRALHKGVGAKFVRKHVTFRIRFDGKEWSRSEIIAVDTRDKIVKEREEQLKKKEGE